MTVRIGTGSSAVDPSVLRVAGVAPSKIMLGTGASAVEVWTAVITVTPQAPTFLTASPWYTLPTQAGVTYTVSGTPGYNQSVTVTATAQAGYELVGTTSWTHTFGPPPRYVASGSGGTVNLPRSTYTTLSSHTVSALGLGAGTFSILWRQGLSQTQYGARVLVNGAVVASGLSAGDGSPWRQTVSIPEIRLNYGDALQFQASSNYAYTGAPREVTSSTWSLS